MYTVQERVCTRVREGNAAQSMPQHVLRAEDRQIGEKTAVSRRVKAQAATVDRNRKERRSNHTSSKLGILNILVNSQ